MAYGESKNPKFDIKYSYWTNCWMIITVILFGNIIMFFLSYYIHKYKSKSTVPYKGPNSNHKQIIKIQRNQ